MRIIYGFRCLEFDQHLTFHEKIVEEVTDNGAFISYGDSLLLSQG